MISLSKRLRAESGSEASSSSSSNSSSSKSSNGSNSSSSSRVSIRDKLLVKEVQEVEQMLPIGAKVKFEDPNALHDFTLTIVVPAEDASLWAGGKFRYKKN